MSEYLSKEAVLKHIRREIGITERQQDVVMTRYMKGFHGGAIRALQNLEHTIQSGAFDADNTVIQRLRAAAIKLHETINSFWQGDCEKANVVAAQSNLCDVLDSIGNHPKQVKPFQQRLLELTIEENKKIYNIPKGDGNDA